METSYLKPKYWGTWFVIGFAKIFVRLPYKVQMRSAVIIGRLFKPLLKRRRLITETNIRIAFPDKSEKEIQQLIKESFDSAYMSAAESLIAWFMPDRLFKKLNIEIVNREVLEKVHSDPKKALLLLGFHFHSLEIAGRYVSSQITPFTLVYRKNNNELLEQVITSSREKTVTKCFHRKNLFPIIKSLKRKVTLWYAPDQDFGHEHTVFVPFFGKQCATLTVTPWLVSKANATVITVYYVRNKDLSGYKVIFSDPIEDFPQGNIEGAKYTNELLESYIRKAPEQYLWQHRRYKTRPEGESKIY